MFKNFLTLLFVLFFCTTAYAQSSETFGKGLNIDQFTEIADILTDPDKYLDKPVKIKGLVIEVCAKRGCWINVAGNSAEEVIQVKVTDGEIVFPMSATGKSGVFEGVVNEVAMSREQLIAYKQHLAEEKGVDFDPTSVTEGTRYIRIIGLGAEISE